VSPGGTTPAGEGSVGWLDCSAGISGDMLLGALVDAGAPLADLQRAVDALGVEHVQLRVSDVVRGGLGARKVDVVVPSDGVATRTWADVRALLERAALAAPVRRTALEVFARLAAAEAAVHRLAVADVHFHEVGALDALADVVGCAAGLHALGLERLTASPVSLGSGTARGAHGPLPVPVPAVLALLAGAPVQAGASAAATAPYEMTTPTGAALLAATVSAYGGLPPLVLRRVGVGAGARDPAQVANVLRLVVGEPVPAPGEGAEEEPPGRLEQLVELAANVDDLDPRLWPGVLDRLLAGGARDAWLQPVLMKKGRPAHVLSVLCDPALVAGLRRLVLTETTTLGVRERPVRRTALDRRTELVDLDGQPVRVKLGLLDGAVVNAVPEWEDVAAAAAALDRPAKQVLAAVTAAAADLR
jgi:pyridinium-3,5-bisthiocarboxylic acid mononucleotide nickel chelatase